MGRWTIQTDWLTDEAAETEGYHVLVNLMGQEPGLACYLKLDGDRLVLVRLTIHDDEGIDSKTLRSIAVSEVMAAIRADAVKNEPQMLSLLLGPLVGDQAAAERHRQDVAAMQSLKPKRGPRGLGEDHYRQIAVAYLDLASGGMGRGLVQQLARDQGRPTETVRDWIHEARRRGFLTKGERGKVGALPGPRLAGYRPPGTQTKSGPKKGRKK